MFLKFAQKLIFKNKLAAFLIFLSVFFIVSSFVPFKVHALLMCSVGSRGAQCNNGPSSTNSGGCGTACDEGNPWSKYDKIPYPGSTPSGYVCFPGGFCLKYLSYVCSTADKCVSPSDNGLKAGYCNCSTGGLYKVCCNGSARTTCSQLNQDNLPDPEGVCNGTTVIGTSCPSTPAPGGGTGLNCGGACAQNGCNSCACVSNGDGTSSSYNWSSLGSTSDCSSCSCGMVGSSTPPPSSGGGACTAGTWSSTYCATCGGNGQWNASCSDWGNGSNTSAWCACERQCTGSNSNPACMGSSGGNACVISAFSNPYTGGQDCPSGKVLRGGCCQCP